MTLNLEETNEILLSKTAAERLRFGIETFGADAVLLSSMQKTASVLMHMIFEAKSNTDVLFVDTGFHFHETLALRDEFMRRYHLNVVTLYPALTPEQQEEKFNCKLWRTVEGQPVCCDLRKGKPFLDYMKRAHKKAVFGGLMRSEGKARARLSAISADPRFGGCKINPLVDWTAEQVDAYLADNDVPVHPLHSRCYPSIGCQCCTTPVMPGEDARAGRWRHLRQDGDGPAYCGINFSDGSGI